MKTTSNFLKTAFTLLGIILLVEACNSKDKMDDTTIEKKAEATDQILNRKDMPKWRPVYAWVRSNAEGC